MSGGGFVGACADRVMRGPLKVVERGDGGKQVTVVTVRVERRDGDEGIHDERCSARRRRRVAERKREREKSPIVYRGMLFVRRKNWVRGRGSEAGIWEWE